MFPSLRRHRLRLLSVSVIALVQSAYTTTANAQETPANSPNTEPSSAPDPPATPTEITPPPAVTDTPAVMPMPTPGDKPLRPMRFTGTLGVISLPRLLSLEALVRFRKKDDPKWDLFALGVAAEYLPPGIAKFGDDTTLSWFQVGAEGRFFVWHFLFAGARLGWQYSRADSQKFGSEVDYLTRSLIFSPKIGALYTFKDTGFTIGGDLGATIPIAAGTTLESDGTTDSNARKAAKTFGMFVMPALSVRLGWTI